MKYAIVKDGEIVNVTEADPIYAAKMGWTDCPEYAGIGWINNNGTFQPPIPPSPVEEDRAASTPVAGPICSSTGGPGIIGAYVIGSAGLVFAIVDFIRTLHGY